MRKFQLLFTITLLLLIASCKKESSIGADILPPDDLLNVKFTDSFTVFAKSLADTALRSDKLAKNYLGVINDPLFGTQKASVVLELDKPNTVLDDTLGPFTLDSVVLLMRYNFVYGDTTVPQSFNVSSIASTISENTRYYSDNNSFPSSGIIGSVSNYLFQPTAKVKTSASDTVGVTNVFRVKLNSYFGYSVLNLGQTILRDSASFKNAIPGIRIENATNSGKAMAELDFNSAVSGVVIYYKDKRGEKKEMRLFASIVRAESGSLVSRQNGINIFTPTYSSVVQNTINSGLVTDSVNYILGQAGTTVKVSFPTLENLGKVAVNKATLSITQIQPNSQKEFDVPTFLLLLKRNSEGLLDVISSSEGVGIIDSTKTDGLGNKIISYTFTISRFVQDISKGVQPNTDIYIATYRSGGLDGTVNALNTITNGNIINFGYGPYRAVIAGPNYSVNNYRMKLNLTYSVIK